MDFVHASDHDQALAQLALARRRAEVLAALVRQVAHTTPLAGEWERTYRALQAWPYFGPNGTLTRQP